jgi:hypothetical protein
MPRESHMAVYVVDTIVAIFLLIASMLTFVVGLDYLWYLGQWLPNAAAFITVSAYLVIVLGLAGIIYGIKRMIDDIAKAMTK